MKELIQSYLNWLNQKFSIQEVNGFFEINTPFVKRFCRLNRAFLIISNKKD
jgi:hypothetical protein